MTAPTITVVSVHLQLEQGGQLRSVQMAGGFDQVRSQDQARAVGRAIGDGLADNLAQRLQHGETL